MQSDEVVGGKGSDDEVVGGEGGATGNDVVLAVGARGKWQEDSEVGGGRTRQECRARLPEDRTTQTSERK